MALEAGSRLGHYEIVELLGAGGMGAVYRARDPRLNREVAIKVLTAQAAGDATLLRRLEQEARTIAGLNHPNLVGIFDIGTHDGAPFLVMELLHGATLREKLAAGPLPLRRAVEVARQVAQGLAAAHASGVVHRDLKPDNIFITSDGRAKILDFGLAKTTVPEASADAATMMQEVTHTQPGTVMGTVGYMAPEQVRGEAATPGSDIFSFGAILYEMFCGRRAFAAASSVETMSAILRDEPPEPLVQGAPLAPELERIVRRCLEKEPQRRFQSAADLDFALAAFDPSSTHLRSGAAAALAGPRRQVKLHWLWPVVALAAGFVLAAVWGWPGGEPSLRQATYTPIAPIMHGNVVFWSPDSSAIAYAAQPAPGQHDQIFVRYLNATTPVQLTHAASDVQPAGWSQDGASIYFDDADGKVWSVAVVGGAPRLVFDWKGTGMDEGVRVVVEHDGAWAVLVQPAQKNFSVWTRAQGGTRWTQYQPDPFTARTIVDQPSMSFSPDGHSLLLYMNSERSRQEAWLLPYPADAAQPPRQVLQGLPQQISNESLAWLPDSRHVLTALPPATATAAQLWLADTRGSGTRQLTTGLMSYFYPSVSPDGGKMVFARRSGDLDVISVDLATAAVTPLLSDSRNEDMPSWALHAPVMVYSTDRNGPRELWLHTENAGGGVSERPIPLANSGAAVNGFLSPALSPSADRVLYDPLGAGGSTFRLMIASVAGGRPVRVTNDTQPRLEINGNWSPDGNTIIYYAVSGNNGDLMAAPATGNATPVRLRANIGPLVPVWAPDGRVIVCQTPDQVLHLITPDGKSDRALGKLNTLAVAFSADSKQLYGIAADDQHVYLEAMDVATGALRRIGDAGIEYAPNSSFQPGYRFTLTPDGKHLSYATGRFSESLYLMQNFSLQTTGWAWLREMLHIPQP
ncbi:MAG TPA: protein kinase [Terriglobales bacterium]|nr:protein kinase [Terriglobales bacterium]